MITRVQLRLLPGFLILAACGSTLFGQEKKETHAFLDKEAAEKEFKLIEGVWYLVKNERNGSPFDFRKKGKSVESSCQSVKFENGQFFISPKLDEKNSEKVELGRIGTLRCIDTVDKDGRRTLGIYKFDGEELIISWNGPDEKSRPDTFKSQKGGEKLNLLIHLVHGKGK